MSIFSSISKFISGQKSKRKTINGQNVNYRYFGNPVYFDPFTMIKDLGYQLNQAFSFQIPPEVSLESLVQEEWDTSTIQAGGSWTSELISGVGKVARVAMAGGTWSLSIYHFYLDNQPLAQFIRCYDYGSSFKSFVDQPIFSSLSEKDKKSASIWIGGESGRSILAQEFGQSQFWIIKSLDKIKDFQESLNLI